MKDDCSNPPGGLTLLKLYPLWKKGKTEKLKSLGGYGLRGSEWQLIIRCCSIKITPHVGNKVNTKGRIKF